MLALLLVVSARIYSNGKSLRQEVVSSRTMGGSKPLNSQSNSTDSSTVSTADGSASQEAADGRVSSQNPALSIQPNLEKSDKEDQGDISGSDPESSTSTTSSETPEPEEKPPEANVPLPVIPVIRQGLVKSSSSISPEESSSKADSAIATQNGINPFLDVVDAQSVVFVIDQSSSMSDDNQSRVIKALKEAIDHLREDQQFLVVFFNDYYQLHDTLQTLADATEQNKRSVKEWLDTRTASGGTQPLDAMVYAIRRNPTRIVILSDGEFNPLEVNWITSINHEHKRPIRIDAIGLNESVLTLQDLAKKNSGIYYQAK